MPDTVLSETILLSLFLQSLSYGIFLVSFGLCLISLLGREGRWKSGRDVNWQMVCVSVILFTFATFDWGMEMFYVIDGFLMYGGPDSAEEPFGWTKVANVSFKCPPPSSLHSNSF